MGNSTSSTNINASATRKSTAGKRAHNASSLLPPHKKLDEEFSDLILHQVKPDSNNKQVIRKILDAPISYDQYGQPLYPGYGHQFSNDLIEDEFNELNQVLIETDATEISRNILSDDVEMTDALQPDPATVNIARIAPEVRLASNTPLFDPPRTPQPRTGSTAKSIPVEIKWVNLNREPIHKIAIIGSFSNWRDIIKMVVSPTHPDEFITTLLLPLGVHKLLYIINNEYRVSDQLPTATDQEGILFNWFEVMDDTHLFNHSANQPNHLNALTDYDANIISSDYHHTLHSNSSISAGKYEVDRINNKSNNLLQKLSKEMSEFEHVENMDTDNDTEPRTMPEQQPPILGTPQYMSHANSYSSNKYVPYNASTSSSFQRNQNPQTKLTYSNEIPEMFVNYDYFKQKGPDYELPEPPQLPAHLNNVLLNKISQSSSSSIHQNNASLTNIPHQFPQSYSDLRPPNTGFSEPSTNKRPPLRRADSSYYASNKQAYHLSIPNHVILNHLMTTSIRNDVLTVACITRYLGKFVTQIMHSPAE